VAVNQVKISVTMHGLDADARGGEISYLKFSLQMYIHADLMKGRAKFRYRGGADSLHDVEVTTEAGGRGSTYIRLAIFVRNLDAEAATMFQIAAGLSSHASAALMRCGNPESRQIIRVRHEVIGA